MNTHTYRLCIAIIALQFGAFLVGKAPINITQHPALPIPMSPAIIKMAQLRKDWNNVVRMLEKSCAKTENLINASRTIINQELQNKALHSLNHGQKLTKRLENLTLLLKAFSRE